ncbi:MAG: carbohydrate ABC transporter permease [Firmicutes bacterium]|nr:carbohydrate ABC transporter permease [Bacillota bacterium]
MKQKNTVLSYVLIIAFCILFLFPIYWMLSTSFKTNDVIMKLPPQWIPRAPTLQNYLNVFGDNKFLTFYKNSIIVSLSTTVTSLILAVLASYSFSRFKFFGSNAIQMVFLSTQMFPAMVLLIAMYTMYRQLNLINTYTALVLACTTKALPLSVWVLKGFYDGIPRDLEEAASIDGCGRYETLFKVILPLIKPGALAVAIYAFLVSWDDFLWGLTLVNKLEMRTLTPGISLTYLGEFSYDWAKVMTAAVGASVPVLTAFIFMQKYMISGLTVGAVKG